MEWPRYMSSGTMYSGGFISHGMTRVHVIWNYVFRRVYFTWNDPGTCHLELCIQEGLFHMEWPRYMSSGTMYSGGFISHGMTRVHVIWNYVFRRVYFTWNDPGTCHLELCIQESLFHMEWPGYMSSGIMYSGGFISHGMTRVHVIWNYVFRRVYFTWNDPGTCNLELCIQEGLFHMEWPGYMSSGTMYSGGFISHGMTQVHVIWNYVFRRVYFTWNDPGTCHLELCIQEGLFHMEWPRYMSSGTMYSGGFISHGMTRVHVIWNYVFRRVYFTWNDPGTCNLELCIQEGLFHMEWPGYMSSGTMYSGGFISHGMTQVHVIWNYVFRRVYFTWNDPGTCNLELCIQEGLFHMEWPGYMSSGTMYSGGFISHGMTQVHVIWNYVFRRVYFTWSDPDTCNLELCIQEGLFHMEWPGYMSSGNMYSGGFISHGMTRVHVIWNYVFRRV